MARRRRRTTRVPRPRASRSARLLAAAVLLGAASLGALLGLYGFEPLAARFAPWTLAVDDLTVLGNERVPLEELRAALALPAGTPVLSADRAELVRRLEAHAWVQTARVALVRPGRMVVEVREREPAAITTLGMPPTAWWVDADGTPFEPAGQKGAGHPRVAGPADALPGAADARLREGVRIARTLAAHGLPPETEVEVAGAPPAELPALRLPEGTRVLLGPGDLERKLSRLDALLEAGFAETRRAEEIDLRFGDRLVLRSGPSAGADEAATAGGRPASLWKGSAG